MPTILLAIITAFLLIAAPCVSQAVPIKTFVAEFNVVGAPNKDELKVTLQGLLASRLNPAQVQLVEKPDQAEVLLTGSYALFGKMFSIDVLLKNSLNGAMAKVFEQGESQDDLIPAFGRLAQKLEREFAKARPAAVTPSMPASSPVPAPAAAKITASATAYKVEAPVASLEEGYVVKSGHARPQHPRKLDKRAPERGVHLDCAGAQPAFGRAGNLCGRTTFGPLPAQRHGTEASR